MILIMSDALENHLRGLRTRDLAFDPGQYLFHAGDRVRFLYFVRTGSIHLTRTQRGGADLFLQRAGPGSILAEASYCSETYHCDAVTSETTRVTAYAKAEFRARLRSQPGLAEAWAEHLAHELQRARLQAEILSLRTVAEKLNAWIEWHGAVLPRKGTWRLIAGEIGVSPEALYREIANRRSTGSPSRS